MSDIDLHHLSAAYALDALEHHERTAFEAHYESCDVCRADVLAFRETLAEVALASAAPPPLSLKERVLAEVATTRQLSPVLAPVIPHRSMVRKVAPLLVAAAAIAVVLVSTLAITGRNRSDGFSSELAHLLEQPDVRLVDLKNAPGTTGTFRVAWSPALKEAALIGDDLRPTPAEKAYELWLVTPQRAMAMSVLDPANDGNVHRVVPAPVQPTAWAITVEPKAGSPVATGAIISSAEV
jgi:anti-sigma-K factor RskA